jgi:transcriptional regulator with XRE-family HTH domain
MKKLTPIALGMAVRMVRENAKMSATDLAKMIGITSSSLSRTENGYRAVELAEAELICACTGTSLNELIEGARRLDNSGVVQQRVKAMADLQRSLAEVKSAADQVMNEIRKN